MFWYLCEYCDFVHSLVYFVVQGTHPNPNVQHAQTCTSYQSNKNTKSNFSFTYFPFLGSTIEGGTNLAVLRAYYCLSRGISSYDAQIIHDFEIKPNLTS